MRIDATVVFQKNYAAISEVDENGNRKFRHIVNTGSSRSSKTHSLLQIFYLYAMQNPTKRLSVWRDTKKDCKDTVLKDMLKAFRTMPNYDAVVFNKTESIFTFNNNSTIEICGTDDEEKVHGFQGDVIWLNEPYKVSKETFDQLAMRTADFIFIDWNPKKSHWIETISKQDDSIVIHSTFKDNPFCPIEMKKKILSYEPWESKTYEMRGLDIYYQGKIISDHHQPPANERNVKNQTANKFMWLCYGLGLKAEKPNRIFRGFNKISKEEFDLMPYNSYYGLDFGSTNPSALIEVKTDGNDSFFARQLLYQPISEMTGSLADNIHPLISNKQIPIVCDYADPVRISELRLAGLNAIPCTPKAVNARIDYINSKKIYYTEDSKDFEYEYENYEWEVYQGINLERPIKQNDHAMDSFAYCVMFLQFYLNIK